MFVSPRTIIFTGYYPVLHSYSFSNWEKIAASELSQLSTEENPRGFRGLDTCMFKSMEPWERIFLLNRLCDLNIEANDGLREEIDGIDVIDLVCVGHGIV